MRTDYRRLNYEVMMDTMHIYETDPQLQSDIAYSIQNEKVIYEKDSLPVNRTSNPNMKVRVINSRTMEAAEKYKDKKVAVLDFANNHSAGGGPFGCCAQEESMCHISTLLPCLEAKETEYYQLHQEQYHKGIINDFGNDDIIYVPKVTVFKTDSYSPVLRDTKDRYQCDVIVSAAPVVRGQEDVTDIMRSRIRRILDVALSQGVTHLILGAFGCGAFHNSPDMVADIMNDLIKEYPFEVVEFAIMNTDTNPNSNFSVFQRIIEEK